MNLLLGAAAVLVLAMAGVGALRLLWPGICNVPRPARLALGYCVGCWLVAIVLFGAYVTGNSFSRWLVIAPVLLLAIVGAAFVARGCRSRPEGRSYKFQRALLPVLFCLLALAYSWARPVYGYDAVMMWGLKAKMTFFAQTWPATMFDPFTTAHTEYPPVVPSAQAFIFFWLGQFDDVASRVVFAAFFASGAAILWWLLEGKWIWVVWWCALPALMEQVKLTYADLPLTVYLLVFYGGVMRWLREPTRRDWLWLAGLFGGMAFWVKQDALLGVGAGLIALLALKQFRAWPILLSLIIAIPWRVFVTWKHLPSDFALTVADLPLKTAQVIGALGKYAMTGYAFFWPVFLLALVLGWRRLRSIETRWLLVSTVITLLGIFAVYWFSKPNVPALLETSLERILLNLFVPALLLTAWLWPETRPMQLAIVVATCGWAVFEVYHHTRAVADLHREFGGRTVAQQHFQAVEPALARQIAGALHQFPTGTHVQVLPKRSLWRHRFYYETYPYLVVDSAATNVVELVPE